MDIYEFYSGRSFDAYRELGAHVKKEVAGKKTVVSGVEFVTYAPNALGVNVIGEFNDWNETVMERCYDGSFFKVFGSDTGTAEVSEQYSSSEKRRYL